MSKVIQATYHNGNLVLDEELDAALEGNKLTLILVEVEASNQSELEQQERTQNFLEWAQQYSAKLPPDYQFDREEDHERSRIPGIATVLQSNYRTLSSEDMQHHQLIAGKLRIINP